MRIAYSVHGYGRGHASRALGILPHLEGHQVTLLAGGDAYELLSSAGYKVYHIPTLGYKYDGSSTRFSKLSTFRANLLPVTDIILKGPAFGMVANLLQELQVDVVISDSEPWSQHAANMLGIHLVSFDHFGIFAHCSLDLPPALRVRQELSAAVYKWYMGSPDTVIASAFFGARPLRPDVHVVGPIVREEIKRARPTRGNHLLVYFNKGQYLITRQMEEVLGKVGCEVRLYGKGALPRKGNIMYRKTGPDSFTDDLVTCRAVISSAGNQLVGETMWLGKPILVIPEHSMDQRLNARSVVDYRVGMQTTYDLFTTGLIENFLRNEHRFRKNCEKYARDATTEVIRIVQQRALAGHAAKQPHPALQIIPPESFSRTARPAPLRAPDLHASGRP